MRVRVSSGPLSVQAVAGPHVVLLGMNLPEAYKERILGFAIQRMDHTEGERYWLRGTRTFAETQPGNLAPGTSVSTRDHPIQAFMWGDYTAKPNHRYSYRVVALEGRPKNLQPFAEVTCDVRSPSPNRGKHGVFFNRGAAASQAWIAKFGFKSPDALGGPEGYRWLSRGLEEALTDFVDRAGPGDGLRAAVYEWFHAPALEMFARARDRGANVRVIFDAKLNSTQKPRTANLAAIAGVGIDGLVAPRQANPSYIAHNKFVVLLGRGVPRAVWTGSTNLTRGGIFGHSNVGHVVRDPAVAARFLAYWQELSADPPRPPLAAWNELEELPAGRLPPRGVSVVFSPRASLAALEWYAQLMDRARQAVFFTAAFGVSEPLRAVLEVDRPYLRYGLLERADATIELLKGDRNNVFAVGSRISSDFLGRWAAERLTGFNTHVKYIHTKFMLVDPLTADPIVITGSANFSDASTRRNDENMLVIRGDTRVADIYLGEFMRLFNHFQFRQRVEADIAGHGPFLAGETHAAAEHGALTMPSGEPTSSWSWHLSPKADWAWPYYRPGWRRAMERELFA